MDSVLETGITRATLGVSSALSALVASLVILAIALGVRSYRRRQFGHIVDNKLQVDMDHKVYDMYDDQDRYSTTSSVAPNVIY